MGEREAIHNIFLLTSKCIKRFGLFDENIYPALCEGGGGGACAGPWVGVRMSNNQPA